MEYMGKEFKTINIPGYSNYMISKNEELGLDDFDPDAEYGITDYTRFVEDKNE